MWASAIVSQSYSPLRHFANMSCLVEQLLSIYQHFHYTRIIPNDLSLCWEFPFCLISVPTLIVNPFIEFDSKLVPSWKSYSVSSDLMPSLFRGIWTESLFLEWGAFCRGAYLCLRIYVKEKEEEKEEWCDLWRQGFSVWRWLPWNLLFRRLALNSEIDLHLLLEC